jgi:predicted transcriptional regulator
MNNSGYTVKQIADLLKVSKTAIQKVIKNNNINYDEIEKNRQIYYYNTTVKIILLMRNDFDLTLLDKVVELPKTENRKHENFEEKTGNQQTTDCEKSFQNGENNENKTENTETNSKTPEGKIIDILQKTIDTLQNQLIEKDKQIENQDKHIERLTILLHNEQQNHIKAIAEITEGHQQQKKKGFFSRLFRKNS